jgi:DNA repair protein RecO (recombination protein O)
MRTKALILKKQNTNEYDQWVTCYTEEFGKLKTVAKSILKPSSIQSLHLDIFNLVEFDLINGRGMPIITGAQVIDSFGGIKSSFAKTVIAYFFAEAIDKMIFENDKDERLWPFLITFLDKLNKCDHNPNLQIVSEGPEYKEKNFNLLFLLREGQTKLLDILGYFPEASSCKACEDKLDESNFGAFNHLLGGIVCKKCFLSGHGGILISHDEFSLLRLNLNTRSNLKYRKSVLDGMFEYISGGKFYSLDLLNMVK